MNPQPLAKIRAVRAKPPAKRLKIKRATKAYQRMVPAWRSGSALEAAKSAAAGEAQWQRFLDGGFPCAVPFAVPGERRRWLLKSRSAAKRGELEFYAVEHSSAQELAANGAGTKVRCPDDSGWTCTCDGHVLGGHECEHIKVTRQWNEGVDLAAGKARQNEQD